MCANVRQYDAMHMHIHKRIDGSTHYNIYEVSMFVFLSYILYTDIFICIDSSLILFRLSIYTSIYTTYSMRIVRIHEVDMTFTLT